MLLIRFAFLFFKIGYRVLVTHPFQNLPFLKKRIAVHLENAENLTPLTTRTARISHYTRVGTIFYTWLEELRARPLNQKQREATLLFCVLTPILDDAMDDDHYSEAEIRGCLNLEFQRFSQNEQVGFGLFHDLEARVGDVRKLIFWEKAIDFQLKSGAQIADHRLSEAEIREITYGKGGFSLLHFMKSIVAEDLIDPQTEIAVFDFGAIIQLTNDIFDTHKDLREGLQTLATTCRDIRKLRTEYEDLIAKNRRELRALPYPTARKRHFLLQFKLFYILGRIALDQLQALQDAAGGVFIPENHTRKQLVCDMDRWINRIRYGFYFLKIEPDSRFHFLQNKQ
jgi:hypothetical protein